MASISLNDIAAFAEIIGAGTIITGLIFGALQIRAYRSQQRDRIATNLMQTFYSAEFSRAIVKLHQVPDGISMEELQKMGAEFEDAAAVVSNSFETIGLLAYKKIAPFDMVMELTGGMVISMHRKLAKWIEEKRETQNHPGWSEWFEWLARRAKEHSSMNEPAYLRTERWKP